MLKAVILVAVLIGFVIAISFFGVFAATHPKRRPMDITPEDLRLGYEEVSFQTDDGLTLRGWFIPSKTNQTIIVLHGYPFNKANILPYSKFLHPIFQVFLFDFRAMGESDGMLATGGLKEQEDLKAAFAYLKSRKDVSDIGIVGFSYGAAVALLAGSEAKAIVADSSFVSLDKITERMYPFWIFKWPFVISSKQISKRVYGIDTAKVSPLEAVESLEVPVLFIHGTADSQIPYTDSERLYEKANEPKELWLINGSEHGMGHAFAGSRYERKVRDFLYKHLK